MPESVKDRCTKSHEYIFLLSKSPRYYFDYESIREVASIQSNKIQPRVGGPKYSDSDDPVFGIYGGEQLSPKINSDDIVIRQKRDVWDIPTSSFKEAHFATFPKELVRNCLLAGCPIGGVVIDPFMGSGTVGAVAKENHRKYVGIDLNPKYVELANDRISGMLEFKNAHEVYDNQIKTQSLW
jgi:site-specific DNA-methyltransferase (adenine-specific)